MKNAIKKNQIIIFTIALMLIAAGYMNYTANTENALKTAAITDTEKYGDLGDARLVSGNVTNVENCNNIENNVEAENTNTVDNNSLNNEVQINEEDGSIENTTIQTANQSTSGQYFTQSRLDRDNMYSQMLESYQKILNNNQISEAQKEIAQEEITKINNRKNAIMIAENLIKNKGFEDLVIFINDKNTDIVVKANELKEEQIAQIQNILQRELGTEIENIHISNKP